MKLGDVFYLPIYGLLFLAQPLFPAQSGPSGQASTALRTQPVTSSHASISRELMRGRSAQMQGSAIFQNAVPYNSGAGSSGSVAIMDVNGDGKPDLAVANACNSSTTCDGSVGVLLGNGDGTFQAAVTYSSGGSSADSVALRDVSGDGKPDLLVANLCNSSADCNGSVGVLLGNGDGTFQSAVTYGSNAQYTRWVGTADVNRDGKLDLLAVNECDQSLNCANGSIGVLLGNGDGTFQPATLNGSGGWLALSGAVADLNKDGKPDLLVADSCDNKAFCVNGVVGVLLGNGDGTFKAAVAYSSRSGNTPAAAVAVADVNGDGKPDLVIANQCSSNCGAAGSVGILLGNGDGTFKSAVDYDSGGFLTLSVAVGDVNRDGKPDVLLVNECDSSNCGTIAGTVSVLIGNGDGTFQLPINYGSGGDRAQNAALGDLNGDGKPDLAVANLCDSNDNCLSSVIGVLLNVATRQTATALTSSPNPSRFGQAVTFTATVTAKTGGIPTGTVSFQDGTTKLGKSSLNGSGVSTLTVSTLLVGKHSIRASYSGDAQFTPSNSPILSQVIRGAIAELSPSSLTFGTHKVGTVSAARDVTLTNSGDSTLSISAIGIAGTNSADFLQTNTCTSPLPAGASCTISVTFRPKTKGALGGIVSVSDNAEGSPQIVWLSGTGT